MNGPGQHTGKVGRFIILVVDEGGRQHGWEVKNGDAEWVWTGVKNGSSHAEVKVRGEFFRMMRQPDLEPFHDPLTELGGA